MQPSERKLRLRPSDGTEFDGQLAFIGPTLRAGAIPQQNLGPVGSCWLVFGDEFFFWEGGTSWEES